MDEWGVNSNGFAEDTYVYSNRYSSILQIRLPFMLNDDYHPSATTSGSSPERTHQINHRSITPNSTPINYSPSPPPNPPLSSSKMFLLLLLLALSLLPPPLHAHCKPPPSLSLPLHPPNTPRFLRPPHHPLHPLLPRLDLHPPTRVPLLHRDDRRVATREAGRASGFHHPAVCRSESESDTAFESARFVAGVSLREGGVEGA